MPFVQITSAAPVSAELAARLAAEVAGALGLPDGAVVVQRAALAAEDAARGDRPVDLGAVAVVRGRLRDPAAMREAVTRVGALLAAGLGLDPDLVFVSWPDPGTAATGAGALT
ncbi:hypothetical protein [Thermoactinospora rubra]|uniref:hypothetical protein n=1 Tax=Thermoactinospora rubra TaxID=1088767 RepID=UPI000A103E7D|nr:hypothetical protein [Thermoactinospora rubra]